MPGRAEVLAGQPRENLQVLQAWQFCLYLWLLKEQLGHCHASPESLEIASDVWGRVLPHAMQCSSVSRLISVHKAHAHGSTSLESALRHRLLAASPLASLLAKLRRQHYYHQY